MAFQRRRSERRSWGRPVALIAALGTTLALAAGLAARGESLAAFEGRPIPARGVAPLSIGAGIVDPRAFHPPAQGTRAGGPGWLAGRFARLGATPVVRHGLLSLAAERADLFDEIYKLGQAKNGELKTLTASFVETSTSTLLTRPLVASGVLAVERPSRIALRYSQPEERIVLIEGSRMTMTWPSRNVRESKDIGAAQGRIQKYFVDSSPSELRSHFTVSAREADDRPDSYLVTLVPKRKQIKEGLTRLELWVDKRSLLMAAMRMTFPNGDSKLMTFTDVKANVPIDKTMFSGSR